MYVCICMPMYKYIFIYMKIVVENKLMMYPLSISDFAEAKGINWYPYVCIHMYVIPICMHVCICMPMYTYIFIYMKIVLENKLMMNPLSISDFAEAKGIN
jgi:hypothetical protein